MPTTFAGPGVVAVTGQIAGGSPPPWTGSKQSQPWTHRPKRTRRGISGPPSTIPAVVPGDGWAYAMAAEPMGVAGSPGLEPSGPFALPPLPSVVKFFLRSMDVIPSNYIERFDLTTALILFRPDGLASVSNRAAATVQEAVDLGSAGAGLTSNPTISGSTGSTVQANPDLGWVCGLGVQRHGWWQGPRDFLGAGFAGGRTVEPGQQQRGTWAGRALTGGEIPMDMLLSDPKISSHNDTIVLQQVPELISVGNSSVALIGTLWSVPKESRAEPAVAVDASGSQWRQSRRRPHRRRGPFLSSAWMRRSNGAARRPHHHLLGQRAAE